MRPCARRRPSSFRVLLAAATAPLLVVGAACTTDGTAIRNLGPANPCAPRDGERTGNALVRCSEHSVVYVETEEASGTGVAFEHDGDRYVLTNCHVVDPFAEVAITLDGERHPEIPVVGVDAAADIAVLGPLPDDVETTSVAVRELDLPDRGDDVYLVGYPGEAPPDDPADLESTIAGGIVSRIRKVKAFGQTYVQTDASIAGGQSGGPLFDALGDLVGISGLGFADEFALALSAGDVAEAVDRILEGEGDRYAAVPVRETDDLVTSGDVRLSDAVDDQLLYLPAADDDRDLDLRITAPADVVVRIVQAADGTPLALSRNIDDVADRLDTMVAAAEAAEAAADGASGDPTLDPAFDPSFDPSLDPSFDPSLDDPSIEEEPTDEESQAMAAEVEPGHFQVTIPADTSVQVVVSAPLATGAVTASFTSNLGVRPVTVARDVAELEVGDSAQRVIGRYDSGTDFTVRLEEGQSVEVRVESAQSDVAYTAYGPDLALDPVVLTGYLDRDDIVDVDDSGEGLYGLDAVGTVGGGASGTYRIRVRSNEFMTMVAKITVTDCVVAGCPEDGDR